MKCYTFWLFQSDLRITQADAVLPAFARAGQRHDTLKRVAQQGRCRLLFLVGVKHVGNESHLHLKMGGLRTHEKTLPW